MSERAHTLRRRDVALAGYSVVGVFIIALVLLNALMSIAHENLRWPAPSTLELIGLAAVIALPLALAFAWDRIQSLRLFGVEVSLAALREAVPPIDIRVSADFQAMQSQIAQMGPSGLTPISQRIKDAVRSQTAELVEVNLGTGETWWSTRLYLLAALLDAYTRVPQLVFVSSGEADARRFIGLASPGDTRTELARAFPILEQAFLQAMIHATFPQPAGQIAVEDVVDAITRFFGMDLPGGEAQFREWVTPEKLERWLGRTLARDSVTWPGLQIDSLFLLRVLEREHGFVALLEGNRLREVVDRGRVATRIARTVLERQLSGGGVHEI